MVFLSFFLVFFLVFSWNFQANSWNFQEMSWKFQEWSWKFKECSWKFKELSWTQMLESPRMLWTNPRIVLEFPRNSLILMCVVWNIFDKKTYYPVTRKRLKELSPTPYSKSKRYTWETTREPIYTNQTCQKIINAYVFSCVVTCVVYSCFPSKSLPNNSRTYSQPIPQNLPKNFPQVLETSPVKEQKNTSNTNQNDMLSYVVYMVSF